ncbi:hypothetical protein PHYBLDRAFT_73096 [Phycomyces blakesleeanus NRRL 1555(-)]|uniref:Uncharacterized protein n=1 Tax=Phycomyces blakesleeanus (strain ATCC 8743b / DSM 1359 / FGSC 10004 / NBRC 33097 / NRRL 1555) TaxID=763407 RepID=A0A163ADB8_PHYB8|nr:hypothetical protein PHYBLDRAFT_73096 [Phycomyces blakesleeanus NRRL 1555(-)]OAD72691.1 hypothetical protein PHYBLDRAFT_73096 [Phycomyces blakesleeanus NRRL 1555(-)]|eukprot:XP_018290731.1 hypothetical protein PHYBLDRAFT_73096 [Phycomyces blakesleeanus NRRL 1555(-)]
MNNFTSNSPSENNFVHAAIACNIMPNNNTGLASVMYIPTTRPAGSHVDDNVADPVLAMLVSLNAQMKSLTNQIASMATGSTKSNDTTTRLQETVVNIVSGQTVVQNTASRYNVTSGIEVVTGLSSLIEDDYVPGKRHSAISIRFDLRIMAKTSNTFFIEIDQWPRRVLTSYFIGGYNHSLALALTAYLRSQPQSAGIFTSDLARMKNHFCNQIHESCRTPSTANRKRTASRRQQCSLLLLHWHSMAYLENKEVIDMVTKRDDCAHVLQKTLQTLLESLDNYAVAKGRQRSLKLIPHTRVTCDVDVSNDLKVPLAQWTIKD